jgi:hypothetical protein
VKKSGTSRTNQDGSKLRDGSRRNLRKGRGGAGQCHRRRRHIGPYSLAGRPGIQARPCFLELGRAHRAVGRRRNRNVAEHHGPGSMAEHKTLPLTLVPCSWFRFSLRATLSWCSPAESRIHPPAPDSLKRVFPKQGNFRQLPKSPAESRSARVLWTSGRFTYFRQPVRLWPLIIKGNGPAGSVGDIPIQSVLLRLSPDVSLYVQSCVSC